jgi:hypothetical protein
MTSEFNIPDCRVFIRNIIHFCYTTSNYLGHYLPAIIKANVIGIVMVKYKAPIV